MIERQFPAVRATVARTAAHLAEARELLDEMARGDFERCGGGTAVDIPALHRLGEARGKNVLRHWCETRGIEPLSAARTAELLRQLNESRADARFSFAVPGWTFLRYREKLYLRRASETLERNLREVWDGGNALPMLSLGGVLKFKPEEGRGLSVAKLRAGRVTVRLRQGGERLRLDTRRPRRTLKNLFQEAGIAPWERDRLPLLYCGSELAWVARLGVDERFRARANALGWVPQWRSKPLFLRKSRGARGKIAV